MLFFIFASCELLTFAGKYIMNMDDVWGDS